MKSYHKNPRQITERQYKDLEKWLLELGDLSGIVHDLNSDEIVAGNQRGRVFDINQCEIVKVQEFDEPDKQGTVALGYVVWEGNRYGYRAVRWTERQCEQANIIANAVGGGWDWDKLANEFDTGDLLDWGLTEFDLQMHEVIIPDFMPVGEDEQPRLDQKKPVICPECGHEFEPS